MSFLTIDAANVDVQSEGASIRYEKVGTVDRAFDGTLRSSRRDKFASLEGFRTIPLAPSAAATFEGYDDGVTHTISGDVVGGASLSGLVLIEETNLLPDGGTSFLAVHRFTIRLT